MAAALIATLDANACGVFNLGSGLARPLRDIMSMLRDAIDSSLPLGFGELAYRPDQVMHLEADITALTSVTAWRPKIDLEHGLASTIAQHRGFACTPATTLC